MAKRRCAQGQCLELVDRGYCARHRPKRAPKGTEHAAIYDAAWRRFSKERIAEQPWCADCGATSDLTTEHQYPHPVLCRRCNSRRSALGISRTRG